VGAIMSTIDKDFINLISGSLDKFRRLPGSEKYNFRCIYCGDSEASKSKARGYLLPDRKKDSYYYYCHNCKVPKPFSIFLKEKFYDLYREYILAKFGRNEGQSFKISEDILETKVVVDTSPMDSLKTIESLPNDHFAKVYVKNRQIPRHWWTDLMYTDNFKAFTNTIIPGKFSHPGNKDSRLVIPFHNEDGKLIGFQGRALYETRARYITIMLDDHAKKIFNLDRVDTNKPYYICEGPIDAMFLDNCLAVAGSDIKTALQSLTNIGNITVILDNQPRNKEVISEYVKCVDFGVKVFFWPDYI
jgi:hypothetical protein